LNASGVSLVVGLGEGVVASFSQPEQSCQGLAEGGVRAYTTVVSRVNQWLSSSVKLLTVNSPLVTCHSLNSRAYRSTIMPLPKYGEHSFLLLAISLYVSEDSPTLV